MRKLTILFALSLFMLAGYFSDSDSIKNDAGSFSVFAVTRPSSIISAGVAFTDTTNIPSWATAQVDNLVSQGVLSGYADGRFGANDTLNREQFAKIAVLASGKTVPASVTDSGFSDVPASHWAAPYVKAAKDGNIINGYANGKFGIGDKVTRAQATKILVNAFGLKENTSNGPSFPDVAKDTWYYPSVETAYYFSVINGYVDGKFGPEDPVTRAQVAVMTVSSQNPVVRANFKDSTTTTPATTTKWTARSAHTSLVFNNKMWVMGGYDGSVKKNDVWSSSDGVTWTEVTTAAPWSARSGHTSLVFNNKMWILGGSDKNDVWSSSNGITWTEVTANAEWSKRYRHTSLAFNNKMWVMGGIANTSENDIWSSSDGITWTEVTANAGWSERDFSTALVFNNKMWVIGGMKPMGWDPVFKNDVWSSSDGITWTEVTSATPWSERYGHTALVFDNKMWVLGGADKNDVWFSSEGITWTEVTATAEWTTRKSLTSLALNNKMWVLGGADFNGYVPYKNDVWSSYDGSTWEVAEVSEDTGIYDLFK